MPLFELQKWIELGHVSLVANYWLSSRNFGEVAVIQKFQYFQVVKRVLYGATMLDDMPCHPTWPLHTKLSLILYILKYLNYSYFAKIMTRKPNIGNLSNMTKLYPFLESKKWHLLFEGILW